MRVMVKFSFPTAEGTEALKAGKIATLLPALLEELKPEAAYFYPSDGLRSGHLIVNMEDSSQVLEVGERLWIALGGTVEMTPVMAPEDIQKAMASVPGIVAKYG